MSPFGDTGSYLFCGAVAAAPRTSCAGHVLYINTSLQQLRCDTLCFVGVSRLVSMGPPEFCAFYMGQVLRMMLLHAYAVM